MRAARTKRWLAGMIQIPRCWLKGTACQRCLTSTARCASLGWKGIDSRSPGTHRKSGASVDIKVKHVSGPKCLRIAGDRVWVRRELSMIRKILIVRLRWRRRMGHRDEARFPVWSLPILPRLSLSSGASTSNSSYADFVHRVLLLWLWATSHHDPSWRKYLRRKRTLVKWDGCNEQSSGNDSISSQSCKRFDVGKRCSRLCRSGSRVICFGRRVTVECELDMAGL